MVAPVPFGMVIARIVLLRLVVCLAILISFVATPLAEPVACFVSGVQLSGDRPVVTRAQRLVRIENRLDERLTPLDGQFYLDIAENGYRELREFPGSNCAWFPLLPGILRVAEAVTGSSIKSVLILNQFLAATALCVLYRIGGTFGISGWVVIAWALAWPGAFFQNLLYTESLFLALSSLAILLSRTERWAAAGVVGFLCALTRPQGVLLAVYIPWEYWWRTSDDARRNRVITGIVTGLLPVCGFGVVATISWCAMGDATAFVSQQASFGRSYGLFSPFQAMWELMKAYVWPVSDHLGTLVGIVVLPAVWRRSRALGVYGSLLILVPVLSGTIMSMGRFLGASVPHLLGCAMLTEKVSVHGFEDSEPVPAA